MHPKGVAQKSAAELEQSGELTLEPFGRIEGALRIGSEPGKQQPIRIQLDRRRYASDHHFQFFEYTTKTDDNGRFTIVDVMPGEATVSREASGPGIGRVYLSSVPLIDVVSGETTRVEFGGQGRPIIGKVAGPPGSVRKFELAVGSGMLTLDQAEMPTLARRLHMASGIRPKPSLCTTRRNGACPRKGGRIDAPADCTCFRSEPTVPFASTTFCPARTSSRSIWATSPD